MSKEQSTTKSKGTQIHPCRCTHAYQDEKYGKGQRVWNISGKDDKKKATCTVCGSTR